jgi:methionine aminopeptidase
MVNKFTKLETLLKAGAPVAKIAQEARRLFLAGAKLAEIEQIVKNGRKDWTKVC